MKEISKRDSSIYKEIENFKDYELTQCIIFEMAIRNPICKIQVDEVVKYYINNEKVIAQHLKPIESETYSTIHNVEQIKNSEPIEPQNNINENTNRCVVVDIARSPEDSDEANLIKKQFDTFRSLELLIDKIDIIDFEIFYYQKNHTYLKVFGEVFFNIISKIKQYYKSNRPTGEDGKLTFYHNGDTDNIEITEIIKREGFFINTNISTYKNDCYISINGEDKEVETFEEFKTFIDEAHSLINTHSKIYENFNRPNIAYDELYSINTTTEVDLNKPLDEIIAYITHIKKDLEKNNNILKAPIELLGTKLQKADDISKMCTESKNGKELCFDGRKGITKTQRLADMFFVYDMTKLGFKELKIRTEISDYYEELGNETNMSDTTFRKYRDIALDYIENEKYKEFITGIKS